MWIFPARVDREYLALDPLEIFEIVFRQLSNRFGAQERDAASLKLLRGYATDLVKTDTFFDPVHYLLMHPDFQEAKVEPWGRFFGHGRKEEMNTAFIHKALK